MSSHSLFTFPVIRPTYGWKSTISPQPALELIIMINCLRRNNAPTLYDTSGVPSCLYGSYFLYNLALVVFRGKVYVPSAGRVVEYTRWYMINLSNRTTKGTRNRKRHVRVLLGEPVPCTRPITIHATNTPQPIHDTTSQANRLYDTHAHTNEQPQHFFQSLKNEWHRRRERRKK